MIQGNELIDALGSLAPLLQSLRRTAQPSDLPPDAETDLGIGDDLWLVTPSATEPYRGADRSARGVRGAVFEAQARLARAALLVTGLFGPCLVLVVILVLRAVASSLKYT